jgi:hypothetical protein
MILGSFLGSFNIIIGSVEDKDLAKRTSRCIATFLKLVRVGMMVCAVIGLCLVNLVPELIFEYVAR